VSIEGPTKVSIEGIDPTVDVLSAHDPAYLGLPRCGLVAMLPI